MQSWMQGAACFAAGLFLTNGIPHFVKGICGDRFPTPFAKPPGKGLSSSLVNVLWGIFNFLLGGLLAHGGQLCCGSQSGWWLAALAAIVLAVGSSWRFAQKDRDG